MTHARTRTSTEALAMFGGSRSPELHRPFSDSGCSLGFSFVDSGFGHRRHGCAAGAAVGVFAAARYTVLSRFVLAFVLVAFVVLHIQLARGMEEMHFGVFVSLALFLTYRDWRVIVFGAVLFAVHHVVFDRLQAAGFGLYSSANLISGAS